MDGGGDPAQFMATALDFANNRCWGTLSCSIFVHPTTQVHAAVQRQRLRRVGLWLSVHTTKYVQTLPRSPRPLPCPALSCPALPCLQRKHQAAFDELVAGLRYGAIAVNVPSLLSFATTKLGWGAFPGSTPQVGTACRRLCQLLLVLVR